MVSRDRPRARVNGRFVKSMTTTERHAELLRLRAAGRTFTEIAEALDYYDRHNARTAFMRLMAQTLAQPAEDARRAELARLDLAEQAAWDVLERDHITVSNGKIMYTRGVKEGDPERPLLDDGPVLAAVETLRRLSESRRKLLGLDAASKVQVISDDDLDREEQRLLAELAELDPTEAGEDPGDSAAAPTEG